MKLWQYIDSDKLERYVEMEGLVDMRFHKEFPLAIFTYSRKCVRENVWDDVTEKCRGLIVNVNTGVILARPFEKFFNFGTVGRPETHQGNLPAAHPMILEKIDGSLGILYRYRAKEFIASKGSFHSEHANWMTETYNRLCPNAQWPEGYTPVFEMVCEKVQHHVVHYGVERLYLLALINTETGEETDYNTLYHWAKINGLPVPEIHGMNLADAIRQNRPNEEGYVATWLRPGQTPLRVKIKFMDFLRLQKMLHHVRPKHILEAISQPHLKAYVEEWLNDSTPQFAEFVRKWKHIFEDEYLRINNECARIYYGTRPKGFTTRKEWALYFTQPEHKEYAPVLFAILDQKDYSQAIWKMLEPLTKNGQPMCEEDE